jgi:hypothetical protein
MDMSNNIFIVIVEDDRYGVEVQNVYSRLDRAIEMVGHEAAHLADERNFDMDDPMNADFITWGTDRSYCTIEGVGSVWIADRVVDYVE